MTTMTRTTGFIFMPAILSLGMVVSALPAAAHDAPGADAASSNEEASGSAGDLATHAAAGSMVHDQQQGHVRWHGSVLLFDQSLTTQTVHIGADFQSYDPTYEWWLAFKPRYFLHESKTSAISLNLWMNLYLELTNSDTTARSQELLVGPTYAWATFAHTLRDRRGYKTSFTVGPRITIPTDKAARDAGQLLGLGASAGLSQSFPLRGKTARALSGARVGVNVIFNHPFSQATSGVNDGIHVIRQDVDGQRLISDQLTGEMNAHTQLNLAFSGDLQLSPRFDLSLSYVLLNAWKYAAPATPCVLILTGCASPMTVQDPTTYGVNTWATASVNYDVMDAFSISLGYYNLTSQLGPDGTRRNPLWSPAALLLDRHRQSRRHLRAAHPGTARKADPDSTPMTRIATTKRPAPPSGHDRGGQIFETWVTHRRLVFVSAQKLPDRS